MAGEDPTTWGEVCKNVGFGENLYRTCREKVPEYKGFAGGAFDDRGPQEPQGDFSTQLTQSALAIPAPPPEGWEAEPEGFFDAMFETLTPERVVMYGGIAALIWYFFLRQQPGAEAASPPVDKGVTSTKAA